MNESSSAADRRAAPELLAPAGNWDCARAAIENGANAIYFGLDVGFNARHRAANFALGELPKLMATLRRRGVKGYATLNTLVFTDELEPLERHVRQLVDAGVDAVLVQDVGAARLIHAICPSLPLHASTQMTMTCAETIHVAAQLGIERVVLARELSLAEIRRIAAATPMPLEVFVHGALCVAYSGQCLTSESLGGRSANRGQCAQACRLDYQLLCDGRDVDLGDVKYLLSPQDLAAIELVPDLIASGVASLKIEGRLKAPEYVAAITAHYRRAIDAAMRGETVRTSAEARREMELTFSRGLAPGWLAGNDHKRLVPGLSSAKRGLRVGQVLRRRGDRIKVELTEPLTKGDGIVLDGGRAGGDEVGGRVYGLFCRGASLDEPATGRLELALAPGVVESADVFPGQGIWQTDDPRLTKRLRASFEAADPQRRLTVEVFVRAAVGEPLMVRARCADGAEIAITSDFWPQAALKRPATEELLREQFGRLGGTPYRLENIPCELVGGPMIPLSVLSELRKRLVQELDTVRSASPVRELAPKGVAAQMLEAARSTKSSAPLSSMERGWGRGEAPSQALPPSPALPAKGREPEEPREDLQADAPSLHVLCRSLDQLRYALSAGVKHVYADFHDLRQYRAAVAAARDAGASIWLASLRIHKPGEDGLFVALAKPQADGWLVRNFAALAAARERGIPFVADFSLNATNPLSVGWLSQQGAQCVTLSYDLNRDQLRELVAATDARRLEVVIHQHMPMFHMEHCVFCAVLSPGRNKSDCGRPCDRHEVKLRDRVGAEHVLHADIGCRNTLYNAAAQSGAEAVGELIQLGVRRFRVELLEDAPASETMRLVRLYQDLLAGRIDGAKVWRSLKAESRLGVTRGTLEHPRNPLAIL